MTNPPASAPARDSWATVCAHGRVMCYRRAGTGQTVLLLGAGAAAEAALIDALVARFRVIVPELPDDADTAGWLAGFVEGLGTAPLAVVADAPCHRAALELARLDPDRVTRVALVADGIAEEQRADAAAAGERVSVLVVRLELATDEALSSMVRFLGASARSPLG